MSKKFTMLLAALFLVMGATDAQTKYYKPGERKTTVAPGDKVMFYNTAFNGGEDRTGFLTDDGANFGHSKQKPSVSPVFSEKVGVWTIETAEDNTTYYKVSVKGANGYVGIGGKTNNASAQDLYFYPWTSAEKAKLAGVNSENASGSVVANGDISASDNVWLIANGAPGNISNTWNGNANSFATWSTGHPYAIYSVVEATTAELEDLLNNAKESARESLADFAKLTISDASDAIIAIGNVVMTNNDLEAALNQIDALVVNARRSIDGKSVVFDNAHTDVRGGLSITAVGSNAKGTTSEGDETIWTIKLLDNGSFNLYNFVTDKYLNEPGTAALTDGAGAAAYKFIVTGENQVALVDSNNKMLHQANYWAPNYDLLNWYDLNDAASLWNITEKEIKVAREQYDLADAAKNALPYAIQQAYGLVTDAKNYYSNYMSTKEGSYEALLDNTESSYFHSAYSGEAGDGTGVHYIQADLGAGNSIDEFYFYMKPRSGNGNNRPKEITVYGSNDNSQFTEIGKVTTTLDGTMTPYLSAKLGTEGTNYRYIRLTVTSTNTSTVFFTLSELYFFPADGDAGNLVEAYHAFESSSITSDAMNSAAEALVNAETALALSNIKKEIQAILNANKDNHEEVPALGKYSTEGYNALEAAYEDLNATQESLENAIAAFEASLNRPVYFITSAWDSGYPAGSAIYYDGMNWLWKKANKFDRQMWMTIPGYTNGDVPSVDAYDKDGTHYGFYDYFTGTKMRNLDVQIVAVPSWADAYNLQYSETANNAAMHAQSDKKLVGWNPATISSNQASAWKVEYLGGSYSLGKLSPEKLEALANLQAAFDSKSYLFNATYGDGLGQYQGDGASIYSTLMEVAQFLSSKLSLFADEGCTVENINALTNALNAIEVSINMPEDGKYYRIYGANNVIPSGYYITCHTNNDGGRIALTAEADASTIYYYKDGKLQAYLNGKYIATSSNHYVFDNKDHAASDITFEASNRVAGAFTIKSAGVFLHYKVYFDAVELDRCGVDEAVGHDWYLQEVTMEEINKDIVTDLNQVSDQARYKIYGERGFMYVDAANGIVKSTYSVSNRVDYSPVNEYHNFAIVNIDGKSYLYSVGAKKFVVKSGNTVALVDFPEQEITIEAAADQNTDYDWLIKMGGTNLLNITNQHNSGIYTAYNTEDPGNRWALRKVGKFDPEYATTVRKVSVSYTVDGKTTTKAHAIKEGNTFSFTIPNASFSVVTSCKLGTEEMKDAEGGKFSFVVERDTALSVEIETNLPIKVAENANNIPADAWYYFVMHSNQRKYIQYLPDSTYIEWTDAAVRRDSIDTYSWALVGNVLDGFKLVNRAAKDMALLSKGSGNPSMDAYANGTAFLLDSTSTKIEGAFCLKYPNGNYLNAQGGKVAHWNDADAGSTIIPALSSSESLAELAALLLYAGTVATINNDKAEALTTAISAAQEVYNTSTDNAAVEAQVTALNTAIDNVIKAEVGAGLFRLKNSASGFYMTIVTPEAAAGIQIKAKDSDATKQAFYIESTAEVGVYNIKSTENYFMASSGSWNYGAYKTANEAGRAHKVEYLGEGKYALKTLLGYAGPNKNVTSDGSPLYSNHTADNNGREWELEALNELEVLVVDAQLLKMTVDANTGDKIGEYAAATSETLAAAIEIAKTKSDAATADDVAALQAVMDNTKVILPTADKYYQIYSALGFAETKAVYSDGNAPMWETLNANDKTFFWQAVATADGIALKNVADGKFLNGNAGQSGAWSVSDTPANIDVTILTKEGANGYQYGVVLNDWQMHAAGHNGGKGTSGSIVSWNAEAGSASAWYMVEVELPEFYTVVYNFKYEGATKYTQTATLSAGAEFPEFTVTLPYGVSVADGRPTGTVTGNHTIDFNLKIEKALPFVAATDVNSIKTWYYVQMHANAAVTAYLEDNGGENIAWNNKSVDDSEIDSHLWGFVGDVWNGIKMVNKNTGNAIVSTRGNAVLGTAANATAFIPTISNGVLSDWFCLKYPESNYLNAQGNQAEGAGIVASYGNADNGSSLFVTEYNKEYVVSVSSVGYSTYYSDYRLVIPATVEAYVVTSVENREVVLEQVTGVLPAHTGVILRGKGDHSFVTSAAATAEIETNLLKGTTTKQLITPAEGYTCYVLANPAGGNGVGLYIASLNKDENGNEGNTHFYNNANKVYLPVENPVVEEESGQSARALRFRFGGEGTTEIEPSTLNSQPSTIIYDLTGRRINEIVEKGIYIVNGKKVVIR